MPEVGEGFGFKELESDLCDTKKDLNDVAGSHTESKFYPLNPISEGDVGTYGPKMKCVKEDFSLVGNFNTGKASNLMIIFEKCDPTKRICKSEAEIEQWMSFKYIFLLKNEKKFI